MTGTISPRAKYLMENHPEVMNEIVMGIISNKPLSEKSNKILNEVIEKFSPRKNENSKR